MRPRSIVPSIRMKYLERDKTCSHVGLPKNFMAVGCRCVFREKDSEQDWAWKGVDYWIVKGTSVRTAQLRREFDIEVLGEVKKISGLEITRDKSNGALRLLQML